MAKQKTDKEQKEIIAYFLECNNYSQTARKFGMSDTGVRKIIKRSAGKESTKQLEEKKIIIPRKLSKIWTIEKKRLKEFWVS